MHRRYKRYCQDPDEEVPRSTKARHEKEAALQLYVACEESQVENILPIDNMDVPIEDDQNIPDTSDQQNESFEIDDTEQVQDCNAEDELVLPELLDDSDTFSDSSSCSSFDHEGLDNIAPDPRLSNLEEFLSNEESYQKIQGSVNVSEIEVLIAVLDYSLRYSLPNKGIEDLFKLINILLNMPIVPETQYLLDKLLIAEDGAKCIAVCSNCKKYLREFKRVEKFVLCEHCNTQNNVKGDDPNFFYFLKTDAEIQNLLEQHEDYYLNVISEARTGSNYNDIFDGSSYKQFKNSLPAEKRKSFATFVYNSDGATKFMSSSDSIWPIQVQLNEIPIEERIKNPIVWALWFGKNKPDMNIFMDLFAKSMNKYSNQGIPCNFKSGPKEIFLYSICCCVDSIARAPMQGVKQFNGSYGCNWCLHPGCPVQGKKKKTLKYVLLDQLPPLRNHDETLLHSEQAQIIGKPFLGVKENIPLQSLTAFDVVFGQVPDDLHLMGVVKQFFESWFRSSGKPYSVPKHVIKEIEEMLKSVKLPTCIGRMLRSLKESKSWKAREWESWLFYVSLLVLREIPGFSDYADHWALLVDGMYILKKDTISQDDFKLAENKLHTFASLIEALYSQAEMTFNVHQLEHLLEGVQRWGPLQSHSGYVFESGNGKLKKMIKANKGVLRQICRRIDYNHSARILKKRVAETLPDSEVLKYCNNLHSNQIKKGLKLSADSEFRYLGKSGIVEKKWIESENLSEDHTKSFLRMTKNRCPITSHKKHKKKTK